MESETDTPAQEHVRTFPGWIRAVVWLSATFLTVSVILGMFLY